LAALSSANCALTSLSPAGGAPLYVAKLSGDGSAGWSSVPILTLRNLFEPAATHVNPGSMSREGVDIPKPGSMSPGGAERAKSGSTPLFLARISRPNCGSGLLPGALPWKNS
jgi:hypothetical protein